MSFPKGHLCLRETHATSAVSGAVSHLGHTGEAGSPRGFPTRNLWSSLWVKMGTKASVWEASMVATCTSSRAATTLRDTILQLDNDKKLLSSGLGRTPCL